MSEATAIVTKSKEEREAQLTQAGSALVTLAESLDDDIAGKVLDLARLTTPEVKGMEGDNRIAIPQVYIRQPSSTSEVIPETCKVGSLYSSDGRSLGDSLEIIPILTHAVRKKWGEENIDCSSLDGKTGTKYGKCDGCPYGRFEKGIAPDCSPGHVFYAITEDLEQMYKVDFSKSSARAGRNIRKLVLPPALWSRSFKVEVESKKGNNRNYHVFKTSPTGRRTDDTLMQVCDALHGFFQALYHESLERQVEWAKRLAAEAGASEVADTVEVVDDGTAAVDFSDSM